MNKQIILIVILLIAAGVTAYVLFGQSTTAPSPSSMGEEPNQNRQFSTQIQNLRRIKSLKLDTSIFSNPIFQSLTTEVAPPIDSSSIQKGRQNPFLPF